MERDINDIGRPRSRSSRPTPPAEEQRKWMEKAEEPDAEESREEGTEKGKPH